MKPTIVFYHNPRCSKSRAVHDILEERGFAFDELRYLDTPISSQQLKQLQSLLGCELRDMMRKGEAIYKSLDLDADHLTEEDLRAAILENPILLERPIVVVDNKNAVIGRPPEAVLAILPG